MEGEIFLITYLILSLGRSSDLFLLSFCLACLCLSGLGNALISWQSIVWFIFSCAVWYGRVLLLGEFSRPGRREHGVFVSKMIVIN